MKLFRTVDGRVLAEREDGGIHSLPVASFAELLRLPLDEIRRIVENPGERAEGSPGAPAAPIDGRTEVWASGVTYLRSRTARMDESTDPDIYDRVYAAERPELFFKSPAWRVVTDGVWLSTGTGIVPPDDFTLHVGDVVTVTVEGVATTTNRVESGRRTWDFLEAR
jgi:2-dehydro-3-deoxy-D-arabinonate dehydratase